MRPPQSCRHLLIALLAGPAATAASAQPATLAAPVSASVVKPLTLTMVQNMDLGMVVLGPGLWSGATVSLSRGGVFTCTNVNLTCSGAVQPAVYNIKGSKGQTVRISAPNVIMANLDDPGQSLTLVVDSPTSVTMPNSGTKGLDVAIGGSITVHSTTSGGTYRGTFNVTVDY